MHHLSLSMSLGFWEELGGARGLLLSGSGQGARGLGVGLSWTETGEPGSLLSASRASLWRVQC